MAAIAERATLADRPGGTFAERQLRFFRRDGLYKVSMRGSRGSKIGEAMAGRRRRSQSEPVHPSFDFASISAARISRGPRLLPEPLEPSEPRRSMAAPTGADSPIRAARLPQSQEQTASVIDIESRLKAAEARLKRAADVTTD
ncbi:MAG: hypothetical protein HZB14_10880 [Actinobacteria bacterium]|nr:hypothetical protein [Actinomycetota bacterium]